MKKALVYASLLACAAACGRPGAGLIPAENFAAEVDGKPVALYTLKAGDVTLQVTNFGGRVVSLYTPDRDGNLTDIVVGHDNLDAYLQPPVERFFGACVGPVANRIGNASFTLDGQTYATPANDNGRNTLHGGFKGLDMVVWDVVSVSDTALVLHYLHPDGMEGYPGNLDITMTYAVDADNQFTVRYSATTDQATPVNLSHHPFFCLRGEGNGSVEEYEMYIKASHYLPIDAESIPTGEIAPVEGTPFDFRQAHAIGAMIGEDNEQLRNARGYDHNWCIDKETDGVELVCRVYDVVSGRSVEVLSDQPGLQFYSGNFFEGKEKGANGNDLGFRSSLALETQKYPDAVNHDNFTDVILRPGETYTQTCIYRFGVKPLWEPAGDRIRTAWADEVTPENVHPEYPRPQLVRSRWQSLNGLWDYAIVGKDAPQPVCPDGKILVPFCVESSLSGVGKWVGKDHALWYNTTFTVPASWKERVLLNFDAVDWRAEVYVNGQAVGSHTGGYTAFSFDITPFLVKEGVQQLTVKVLDGTDNGEQPRGKQVSDPRGIWYTPVTGIWQSVWIEPVAAASISDYLAVADIDDNVLDVAVSAEGTVEGDQVEVWLREGGVGYSTEKKSKAATVAFASAAPGRPVRLAVEQPQLWSPESPFLYELEIVLKRDGKVLDQVKGYTAFRKSSEVRDSEGFRRLGLNNEPYFQYGPLDQGWWPDGLYTAPTDEALKFDIVKTKEWGYNMIRKHIKVEPARWYYYCDQLGIVVWQDMPCLTGNIKDPVNPQWGQWGYDEGWDYPLTETAKANYYKEWGEILHQLQKYPCIVVWVPFNEAWSQFETEKAVEFTYGIDRSRLVNSASGGNSRLCGDILDSHNYPDPKMKFRSDGAQIDVLGEYGGIGCVIDGHVWQPDKNWGYKGLSKDGEEVLSKYEAYADEFKGYIADGVSAGVYTQTTDVEIEVNGLMTYDRKVVKVDEARLREINRSVIASMKK